MSSYCASLQDDGPPVMSRMEMAGPLWVTDMSVAHAARAQLPIPSYLRETRMAAQRPPQPIRAGAVGWTAVFRL